MSTIPQNAKGPAEAATSPDRGSIVTPAKDMKMNSDINSTSEPIAPALAVNHATEGGQQ
ncbi:hypothetical protein M8R20_10585 [Pseudomonas sp. R2.Fl]|nr:hypothetical protein [Pseudomonas sp. R2.Fl]